MTDLEQSFVDLCAKHDLLNAAVCLQRGDNNRAWHTVTLQWRDESQEHRRGCVIGHGDTIAEALADALVVMASERIADMPAFTEALPVEQAA